MVEMKRGMVVKSLAGHDKTQVYVIMNADAEYVYLADGKMRTVDRLKRKKKKHVQPTNYIDELIDKSERIEDSYIRKLLKNFVAKQVNN